MSIWEHLDQLRGRIFKAAVCVAATTIAAWCFRERLVALLITPYQRTWEARFHKEIVLQIQTPADAFSAYLELSLTAGLVRAAPLIFYQLWAFVSPRLYKKEKRLIVPFVFFSTTLLLSGVAFSYFVALPFTFNYFLSQLGPIGKGVDVTPIDVETIIDFSTRLLLALGAVFELPLFVAFLVLHIKHKRAA